MTYAKATNNDVLAENIREWIRDIAIANKAQEEKFS